jgi:hypothetical protein
MSHYAQALLVWLVLWVPPIALLLYVLIFNPQHWGES